MRWWCRWFSYLPVYTSNLLYLEQDSPVNKLLYAREIPCYKQMVEK